MAARSPTSAPHGAWIALRDQLALAPAQRRVHRSARPRRRFEDAQRELGREGLRWRVVRPARAVAERKIAEEEPRHAAVLDDVFRAAHHHRRDAVRLEMARDEADRLVADRAIGYEESRIHLIFHAAREDLGTVHLDCVLLAAVGRRAVETRSELHPA